ncbi:MAG: vWA domain-containing protein [bacterium]
MKPKRSLYYKVLSVILTSTFLFSSLVFAPKAYAANNPALASSCGLNVMLVLDSSTSMAASDIATAKSAAIGLVNSLMPSTPTKIGVIDFNTNIQGASLSPTTDKAAVLAKINTYVNHPNGVSTNWQAALQAADGMTGAGDLVIIITDGNPNYPTDAATALTSAVTAANSLKSSGTRVLAIGINSSGTQGGLNQANLEAISGSQVKNFPGQAITNINQVDVALGDINALSGVLSDISSALCPATITVTANTPYTVVSGTSVPFAYNVSVSKGGSQCRLLDNAQAPVNGGSGAGAYSAANPINWIPPLPPGAYGYFVQCRTTVGSVVTVVSNAITVNVTPPPRPDLTASAPPQASATVGTPATFTSTVSNIGSLTTGASFPNFFQLSSAGNGAGTLTDLAGRDHVRPCRGSRGQCQRDIYVCHCRSMVGPRLRQQEQSQCLRRGR